jgi:hypothetical protein
MNPDEPYPGTAVHCSKTSHLLPLLNRLQIAQVCCSTRYVSKIEIIIRRFS